jgi:5'-3' exonuclease
MLRTDEPLIHIPSMQAPGEAEAELASMNTHHIIDAVLTDDSDVFVFGAQTVLRKYVYVSHALPRPH